MHIDKLVLASNNAGKIREFNALFHNMGIRVLPQSAFGIKPIEETGSSFLENALLKAKHASEISGLAAIADDSGLVVPALGGEPGIYSARYALGFDDKTQSHHHPTDNENNAKLLTKLSSEDNRQGLFVCVIVLLLAPDHPMPLVAEGIWQGEITRKPQGDNGFGYDPIFYVNALNKTAAELSPEEKNQYSHRAQAMQQLFKKLRDYG